MQGHRHIARHAGHAPGWSLPFLALALFAACGSETKVTPPDPPPTLEERLSSAWGRYLAADYRGARLEFLAIVAAFDSSSAPWLGLAWTAAQQDSLSRAVVAADSSISLGAGEDGWVARAFITGAAGDDSLALDALAQGYRAPYHLRFDPRVNDEAVTVLRAISLFDLARYAQCYDALREIDPTLELDLEAFDFREALARELARLERLLP